MISIRQFLLMLCLTLTCGTCVQSGNAADLKLLFMGDNGHHRPETRFQELAPALEANGIELKYTDRMDDLNAENLSEFDGLMLYANIDRIEEIQADAVLDYVASGGAFIPIHCATYCWRNNDQIVALMGAQFKSHGSRVFSVQPDSTSHPIMEGYSSFTSWDETYIHHKHNEENRIVLEYRNVGKQAEGKLREPWTWVRTHEKGRIFYTAWGHDERTFRQPGFHNLVERGIRWACGKDVSVVAEFQPADAIPVPQMRSLPKGELPFDYVDVGPKIPNYTPGKNWGAQGKPNTLMQLPLTPDQSIQRFVSPKGTAVRLYADERDFAAKPIAMNWDELGRLWICETVDYPNSMGMGRDRIRICEDTDNDGIADKFIVFAEGLSVPTAIMIFRGGAVVQNETETIYLKDTDGDGKADLKKSLITGWNVNDTHGGVSNFRYGVDNWIWAMQGYNKSTPQIDGVEQQTFGSGFWRFKLSQTDPPDVTDLEFVRSTNNNTWGLGISEDGLIFGSTANANPSTFVPIPNRYYERVKGWAPATLGTIADTHVFKPITESVRQVDQFGGYTAGAGHALYTARTFPKSYWNRTAFVCGPTGHLIGTFALQAKGADYTSTSPFNLLASDDQWSAPIMAEVGPDGAVWVIDWYNFIVQHNPTPHGFETGKGAAYISDLRDKKHGRIYRVVPTKTDDATNGSPGPEDILHEYSDLSNASNEDLVKTLNHPAMTWRLHAQRLLVERSARDVEASLFALASSDKIDEAGLNAGAIHALHTLSALGSLSHDKDSKGQPEASATLKKALSSASASVRRNAVSVLPDNEFGRDLLTSTPQLFNDSDPQVLLQAILKLADMPSSARIGSQVVQLAQQDHGDEVIYDALTSAAATNAVEFTSALSVFADTNDQDPSIHSMKIARRVAEHLGRSNPGLDELRNLVKGLTSDSIAFVVLDGIVAGLPRRNALVSDAELDASLLQLLERVTPRTKGKVVRLASIVKSGAMNSMVGDLAEPMLNVVADSDAPGSERIENAKDLIGFMPSDPAISEAIAEQLNAQISPEVADGFLSALMLSEAEETGAAILTQVSQLTPELRSSAIRVTLSRNEWAMSLLKGIEDGSVDAGDLSLDQKQSLQSYPNELVRQRAEKVLSMSGLSVNKDRDRVLHSLLHLTKVKGNVDSGREMYRKHCSKCHQHGDMGKRIGPNLTGMAVHPKTELLTHIIDPSRSVEGNFRIYTVLRVDGRVANGMMASETKTSIAIIDTEGKETAIPRDDIEELVGSKKSLMPEGFENQMSENELADLLEFLTNKGRFVPIALDKVATAISTKGMFEKGGDDNGPDRMVFTDWNPRTFNGVPFILTDPAGKSRPNIVLLNGPLGSLPPKMPKSVSLELGSPAAAIHILGGVGAWNFPASPKGQVAMIIRLHYSDGSTEDIELVNGVHMSDYIGRTEVPESRFAFALGGRQLRYLSVRPARKGTIERIELRKADGPSSPIVMAVTVETP